MVQRKDTFVAYRQAQKKQRVELIAQALKILSNGKYANISRLAKDVSKLVSEFELQRYLSLDEGERGDDFKPMSHVTLLRSDDYRPLLEKALVVSPKASQKTEISISELEACKIRIMSLETQNQLLKEKIRTIDLGLSSEANFARLGSNASVDSRVFYQKLELVITILDGVQEQVSKAFKTVLEGDETDYYPRAGLYGPSGIIVELSALHELSSIRQEVIEWFERNSE
ncbi:hypothetical protein QFA96_16065 [Pseudomonas sp. Ap32]|nr:hypothetical protein QFA96_16065 [Pseudomonas sp. Ap32]